MTITISENTKRIRKFGETKIKKLPYPSTPISYFGNLDCANSYIDKISIPNSDLNRLINLFPKNTNDYDALICCDEPEIQNYLTENGFVKKNLIDRKKIKYDNLGFKGKVLLSPYSTYTKNNDELYIDVFLNKIGAIDMREYTEVKGISNLYATIQPGAIKEATFEVRIDPFVPQGTVINNTAMLWSNETPPINRSAITIVRIPPEVPVLMPAGLAVLIGLLIAIGYLKGRSRSR